MKAINNTSITSTTSASAISMAKASSAISMATATTTPSGSGVFKIGDKVTGKPGCGRTIVDENSLLEVTAIDTENDTFDAKLLGRRGSKMAGVAGIFTALPFDEFEYATTAFVAEITGKETKKKGVKPEAVYKLDGGLTIKKYEDSIESNFNPLHQNMVETDEARVDALKDICEGIEDAKKNSKKFNLREHMSKNPDKFKCFDEMFGSGALEKAIHDLRQFFVEFQFSPNARFINTFALRCVESFDAGRRYAANYFKLIDSPFAQAIEDKMKSPEFNSIMGIFSLNKPSRVINTRLKVYFGEPGSGKTTKAMKEANNLCVICKGDTQPEQLLQDFDFDRGQPGFMSSAFSKAIKEGKTIVLDEFNTLPLYTQKLLQGILDNKPSFEFKGETVQIHPNFNVIATMNLFIQGAAMSLPEAIVDRCSDIVEFEPSDKDLAAWSF